MNKAANRGQWSDLIIRRHATIQLRNCPKGKRLLVLDLQAIRPPFGQTRRLESRFYRSGLKRKINGVHEPQ
jgi:hypothetical protein